MYTFCSLLAIDGRNQHSRKVPLVLVLEDEPEQPQPSPDQRAETLDQHVPQEGRNRPLFRSASARGCGTNASIGDSKQKATLTSIISGAGYWGRAAQVCATSKSAAARR